MYFDVTDIILYYLFMSVSLYVCLSVCLCGVWCGGMNACMYVCMKNKGVWPLRFGFHYQRLGGIPVRTNKETKPEKRHPQKKPTQPKKKKKKKKK